MDNYIPRRGTEESGGAGGRLPAGGHGGASKRARAAAIVARIPREQAADRMAGEWESQIPALARVSPRSHTEIVAGLMRNLARWSQFLRTGEMPADASFDPLRAWTRARAAEGVRLEDLLRSFALAHRLGWRLLREHARSGEGDALLELAELLAEYHHRVSQIVTETYLSERELLVSEVERSARSLLERLYEERPLEASERELAERLGVPLERPYSPFVVVMPGRMRHRQAALAAHLRAERRALAVTEADCVAGLTWDALDLSDLGARAGAVLAIADPVEAGGLAAAREEVALLAEHARRHGLSGRLDVREHALEILIARSPRLSARLRERVLEPLRSEDHAELLRTLRALVRCRFDRTATSAALHVHRNTLAYRLRRIEEIAGLDLGNPRDLASVYVAVTTAAGAHRGSRSPRAR